MKYFKRKDGSVFGKLDSISKEQIDAYIKDGCVPCNENGEVKKPKRKLSLKKKKWGPTIFYVILVSIYGRWYGQKMIKSIVQNVNQKRCAS